jgi:hypothetical protein
MRPEVRERYLRQFARHAARAESGTGRVKREEAMCKALHLAQVVNANDRMAGRAPALAEGERRIAALIEELGVRCPHARKEAS